MAFLFGKTWRLRALGTAFMVVALLGAGLPVQARTPEQTRAICRAQGRPCVGLVLSGGGARGFAHVGVLKVLDEMGVKVDVVTGTSMGSMIGGVYAAGYTPQQIQNIVLGVDWRQMLSPRAERSVLPWRRKLDDYENLPSNALKLTSDGHVRLPESIIPSQELDLFLNDKTGVVNNINNLEDLAIPFACVATDLVNGNRVVLKDNVNLGTAMRASMSVPGVFAPVNLHGKLLVDGGLTDNIPIDLAREMGADVVIVVNVGTPPYKRNELSSMVTVMAQMVNLLTEQNVKRSLKTLRPDDILIVPDLDNYTGASVKESRQIIDIGQKAAEQYKDALRRYAVPRDEWIRWEMARERAVLPQTRETEHVIDRVEVAGLTHINPQAILNEIDLDTSKPVSNAQIDQASRRIWADGTFTSVRYHFEPGANGTQVLVFEPREKEPGYSSIRVGGSLETDFSGANNFNVVFSHSWNWLNAWGGSWRNELQAGKIKRVMTDFYQPLGPGGNWYLLPKVEYDWQPYDVYENGHAMARYRNETLTGELGLGYSISRLGFAQLSGGYVKQRSTQEIGAMTQRRLRNNAPFLSAELLLDTLDDIDFPTQGYRVRLTAQRLFDSSSDLRYQTLYHGAVTKPFSWNRWSTVLHAEAGRSAMDGVFPLGGAFELTGAPYGRWTGSRLELGTVRISRNMGDYFGSLDQPIWLGASFELGRAWNPDAPKTETGDDRWHKGFGLFVGAQSLIGPIYLMSGHTRGEGTGVYFFWGHPLR